VPSRPVQDAGDELRRSPVSMVIIGMDPHKRSATIEVMTADEAVVGGGRYGTDAAGPVRAEGGKGIMAPWMRSIA
jgi:hypothetical protein